MASADVKDFKRELNTLMKSVQGLQAIIISDKEGVPLFKVNTEKAPDFSMKPTFLATSTITSDQATKLGMGRCNSIYCLYDNNQVVHFNKYPLVITLIATNDANMGMLLALEDQFDNFLNDLKRLVESV